MLCYNYSVTARTLMSFSASQNIRVKLRRHPSFGPMTRKVKGLITLQPSKALVFSQYLANASFFLNFE